jgi:hypothetical protein
MNVRVVQQRVLLNHLNMMLIFVRQQFDGRCLNNYEILQLVLLILYGDISFLNEVNILNRTKKENFDFEFLDEIIDQCEAWIRELQETSSTEKRVSASISQHLASLIRHTNDLKKEMARIILPDDFVIPPELTTFLLKTSSNNNLTTDQVAPSSTTTFVSVPPTSDIQQTSEQMTMSSSTDEHTIQIKIVPNLQYQPSTTSSTAATVDSPTTLIHTETQQSSNSSIDHFELQQNDLSSTNPNPYDVTITHSNSLLSDWTTTDASNVPLPDDGLIYDDLLDDEDDMDDDLDVEDMLAYDGDIPEGYPEHFY